MFSSILATAVVLIWLGYATSVLAQSRSAAVEQHYQRARDALAQHDLQRASQEYAEILKLDPQNAEILTAHGMTLYGLGRASAAAASLKAALSLNPGQSNVELFLGLSQADLGQCSEAVPLLRKHFNEGTETKLRRLAAFLLSCHVAGFRTRPGRGAWANLKTIISWRSRCLVSPGFGLFQAVESNRIRDGGQIARFFPRYQVAGEALETQGKHEQAIKEYRRAVELNPKAPHLHYRIGRLLQADGKDTDTDKKALESFRQELVVNPQDA